MTPIISVTMPAYNGASYLAEATEGILNHTYKVTHISQEFASEFDPR